MHQLTLGKANRFSCQTLDSSSQTQMLALNPLGLPFTHLMHFNWEMSFIRPPAIGAKSLDAKRFKQLLELKKHLIFAPSKHICQNLPSPPVNRVPQPSGVSLLAYKTPHFVKLRFLNPSFSGFFNLDYIYLNLLWR